jgi:hypothetical protein
MEVKCFTSFTRHTYQNKDIVRDHGGNNMLLYTHITTLSMSGGHGICEKILHSSLLPSHNFSTLNMGKMTWRLQTSASFSPGGGRRGCGQPLHFFHILFQTTALNIHRRRAWRYLDKIVQYPPSLKSKMWNAEACRVGETRELAC